MDRIECMKTFVETVRGGSLASAARCLDLPRSTVSKQIQALESSLGVQLLMRTTRSIHLTDAGSRYYDASQDALAALEHADELARGSAGGLAGTLRINAPISFGMRMLAPLVGDFHQSHPDIEFQIALTDQLIDPVRGGFDLTIRIANLQDTSLAARTLMSAPRHLVATPEFLDTHGVPGRPADLTGMPVLNYGNLQGGASVAFSRRGRVERVHARGPLTVDNGDFLCAMAEAGMGIALLPDFITDDAVSAGRLVHLMVDWLPPPIAVHALFPAARAMPNRTRRFVDFLVERLGD